MDGDSFGGGPSNFNGGFGNRRSNFNTGFGGVSNFGFFGDRNEGSGSGRGQSGGFARSASLASTRLFRNGHPDDYEYGGGEYHGSEGPAERLPRGFVGSHPSDYEEGQTGRRVSDGYFSGYGEDVSYRRYGVRMENDAQKYNEPF